MPLWKIEVGAGRVAGEVKPRTRCIRNTRVVFLIHELYFFLHFFRIYRVGMVILAVMRVAPKKGHGIVKFTRPP